MDTRPIGMFDSGVGGLSVLRHLQALAPGERYIYLADTRYFPYGPRSADEVRKRAFIATSELLKRDAKLIVVACNTASAAAISDLREAFPVPFVGMVPGLKPAATSSPNRHVAILATPGTLDGTLYQRVVAEFGGGTRIANVPGHGLAELVEEGAIGSARLRVALRRVLSAEVEQGADTVVLGCTHYHFLAGDIRALFPGVTLVDTGEPVARRAVQVLREAGLEAPPGSEGGLEFIVTGDCYAFERTAAALGFQATAKAVGA
jgi:glutamate racemase